MRVWIFGGILLLLFIAVGFLTKQDIVRPPEQPTPTAWSRPAVIPPTVTPTPTAAWWQKTPSWVDNSLEPTFTPTPDE